MLGSGIEKEIGYRMHLQEILVIFCFRRGKAWGPYLGSKNEGKVLYQGRMYKF